jgi:hypothetical protein
LKLNRLFAAAGLDPAPFMPTQPVLTPQVASDTRAAWTGTTADPVHDALRIEAATYNRRPVFFEIVGPWSRPVPSTALRAGDLTFSSVLLMLIVLPIGAGLVAWRNTRLGRGDRRGAFRLGSFSFVAMLLGRLIGQHHVPTLAEVGLLSLALRDALMSAAIFWLLYMAFEPFVRQRLPGMLISWNRLLVGRFRDPLVGADLLVGIVLGVAGLCVVRPLVSPFVSALAPRLMPNLSASLSLWCWLLLAAVGVALSDVFLIRVMLPVVRRQWLTAPLFVGLISLVIALPGATVSAACFAFLVWVTLTRFGVLSLAAFQYVFNVGAIFPITTNGSAWYAQDALLIVASILAFAVYAFRTTVARRPLWRGWLHNG